MAWKVLFVSGPQLPALPHIPPPHEVGLPSLSLPFSLSLTHYLVGLIVMESGGGQSLARRGWSEAGRKPCLSLKA